MGISEMVEKFDAYLSALPTTGVIKKRIDKILKLHQRLADDEILDIMITDAEDSVDIDMLLADETLDAGDMFKVDDALLLFTDKFIIEHKSYLTEISFSVIPYVKCIQQVDIQTENYDFKNAQRDSFEAYTSSVRITVQCHSHIKIIANGENCSHALEIYKKYILPNLT